MTTLLMLVGPTQSPPGISHRLGLAEMNVPIELVDRVMRVGGIVPTIKDHIVVLATLREVRLIEVGELHVRDGRPTRAHDDQPGAEREAQADG
jgi:hypothetical protein